MLSIEVTYAVFKTFVQAKTLKVQYLDYGGIYYLYAVDGSLSIATTIDQVLETADAADFESVFEPTANAKIDQAPDGLVVTADKLRVDGSGVTQPVSGTFWQATQPVSGTFYPATQPVSGTVTAIDATVLFHGRASTFNTPGRAGTTGQKILSLHNATGSSVTVKVKKIVVDLACTVVKAVTVAPPMVRMWKVTVLPTNGTAATKNKIGGTTTSSSSVTVLGDASADGTGSGTTLTATLPAGTIIGQEYAPRFITAVGYESADNIQFDTEITLAALEGVVVFLDYTAATQNPTTDRWLASIEWTES